jgi:hypothetical protein
MAEANEIYQQRSRQRFRLGLRIIAYTCKQNAPWIPYIREKLALDGQERNREFWINCEEDSAAEKIRKKFKMHKQVMREDKDAWDQDFKKRLEREYKEKKRDVRREYKNVKRVELKSEFDKKRYGLFDKFWLKWRDDTEPMWEETKAELEKIMAREREAKEERGMRKRWRVKISDWDESWNGDEDLNGDNPYQNSDLNSVVGDYA